MKKLITGSVAILFALITFNSNAQVIFSEDFDNNIPGSWTLIDNDGLTPDPNVADHAAAAWIGIDNFDDPGVGDTVACSTSWYNPPGTSDDWLITPQFALTEDNVLSWDVKAQDPNYPDGYEVMISTTTPTIAGFNANAPLYTIAAAAGVWESQTVDLDAAGYSNQTVYLAWHNFSTDQFLLLINNVLVQGDNDDVAASNASLSEYTSIPLSQVGPLTPSADMTNNSINTAINPTMSFLLSSNGGGVIPFNGPATQDSLSGFTTQTFTATDSYTPTALGDYRVRGLASMDATDDDLTNNLSDSSRIVSVTSDFYSRDDNAINGTLGIGNGNGGFLGNTFDFSSPTTIESAQIVLNGQGVGETVGAALYNMVGGVPDSLIAWSDPYVLTAADTTNPLVLNLPLVNGNNAVTPGAYALGATENDSTLGLAYTTGNYFPGTSWVSWPTNPFGAGVFSNAEAFNFEVAFLIRAILVDCAPAAPSITGFSNTGLHGTTVSWTGQSLPELGGFVIRYHEFGQSPNFSWKIVPNENATSAYVNGLDEGTRYVFRVGSKCNMNQNATYSDTSSVWTRNECGQPTPLFGSAWSPSQAQLSWLNLDGDTYKLRYRPSAGGAWNYRNGPSVLSADTVYLDGLMASTTYEWQVRALCDDGGNRPYTALQNFTTPSPRLAATATPIGIYPNPTNGELTIDYHMEESTQASLQILEMNGRVVSTATVNAQEGQNRERMDLTDLAPGFYLVRLIDIHGAILMNERISKN